MFKLVFILIVVIFSACKSSDNSKLWSNANKFYNEKDFNSCTFELTKIVDSNKSETYKTDALFLLSEIYLNEFQEYMISIEYLDILINDFPENELSKRALFTKAYIYANYLDMYTDATILYNHFIDKYPNDDLISSVEYELNELDKHKDVIERLMNN